MHVSCSNFKVHFEYVGRLVYPTQQINFNTSAAYCHSRHVFDFDLSIGIGIDGPSASIGISNSIAKDLRIAEFDSSISYVP